MCTGVKVMILEIITKLAKIKKELVEFLSNLAVGNTPSNWSPVVVN